MLPTVGRIVHYRLSDQDAEAINSRRADASAYARGVALDAAAFRSGEPGGVGRTGHISHVGNEARAGDVYPALIVRVWDNGWDPTPDTAVNLQVFLDGTDVLWATSVKAGNGLREYAWPVRV